MLKIDRTKYSFYELVRHDGSYERLAEIIKSNVPDAEEFRCALDEELAAGFPIDWADDSADGRTLLHWAASSAASLDLLQMLVEAGADVNVKDGRGRTPLSSLCRGYIQSGAPLYLTAINVLLAKGARPEPDEEWKSCNWGKGLWGARRAERSGRLEVYLDSWAARGRAGDSDPAPAFDYAL